MKWLENQIDKLSDKFFFACIAFSAAFIAVILIVNITRMDAEKKTPVYSRALTCEVAKSGRLEDGTKAYLLVCTDAQSK